MQWLPHCCERAASRVSDHSGPVHSRPQSSPTWAIDGIPAMLCWSYHLLVLWRYLFGLQKYIYIHSTTPPIDGTKITEPKMAHACSAIETLKNDRPGFPQHMTSIRRVHENSHVAKMPSMWMWSYINKCLDYVEKHRKPSKTNMAVVTRRHGCMVIYHDLCRM